MKKRILTIVLCALTAYCGALSLTSCGEKSEDTKTTAPATTVPVATTAAVVTTQGETVAIMVTDKAGQLVTAANGEYETTYVPADKTNKNDKKATTKKTKKAKTTKVKGGTDPYVEDIF